MTNKKNELFKLSLLTKRIVKESAQGTDVTELKNQAVETVIEMNNTFKLTKQDKSNLLFSLVALVGIDRKEAHDILGLEFIK